MVFQNFILLITIHNLIDKYINKFNWNQIISGYHQTTTTNNKKITIMIILAGKNGKK